jgi:hypothetical protein
LFVRNVPESSKFTDRWLLFAIYDACLSLYCSREYQFKVKGVSMTVFTQEDVDGLTEMGNERFNSIYLANLNPRDYSIPNGNDVNKLKEFIRLKYMEKKWHRDGPTRSDRGSEGRSSAISSSKSSSSSSSGSSSSNYAMGGIGSEQSQQPARYHDNDYTTGSPAIPDNQRISIKLNTGTKAVSYDLSSRVVA